MLQHEEPDRPREPCRIRAPVGIGVPEAREVMLDLDPADDFTVRNGAMPAGGVPTREVGSAATRGLARAGQSAHAPGLAIDWPVTARTLSARDAAAPGFSDWESPFEWGHPA